MSCHSCASKFNFFNKENGCPQCGFSYCNKCLKYATVIPKLGNTEHMVCKSCHLALTAIKTRSSQPEHPAASLQRLASLETPPRAPITVYRHDQRIQQLKSGLTQTDREIADRLEKLREDRKRGPLPSEEEIADRLALLKGENPLHARNVESKPLVFRSEQQQADDLLNQLLEEQKIALDQPSPVEDIVSRLAKLRGDNDPPQTTSKPEDTGLVEVGEVNIPMTSECDIDPETSASAHALYEEVKSMLKKKKSKEQSDPSVPVSSSDDDEACEQDVLKKILDEVALEEKMELSEDSGEGDSDSEPPWCAICDKNAELKCLGCSGDLYCKSCFKEHIKDFDTKDHKSATFQPSTK